MQGDNPGTWDNSISRKPIRRKSFDYSKGGYFFVTFCTDERKHYLGHIAEGNVILSAAGIALQEQIDELQVFYKDVVVEKSVIMPNHVHLIVVIAPGKRKLSAVVQALKSLAARRMENCPGGRMWQRSFYDHIIRDEYEYERIWEYIANNTLKWQMDIEYTGVKDEKYYEKIIKGK